MFWERGEVTLGGVEGLELRLVGSWNKQVSHYHVSETGTCIRNVKDGQTLYVVQTRSRDSGTRYVGELMVWFGKQETVMEEWA